MDHAEHLVDMQATATLPTPIAATVEPRRLDAFLSQKLRFGSPVAMLMLVYVHAYNLHPRYLHPAWPVEEPVS